MSIKYNAAAPWLVPLALGLGAVGLIAAKSENAGAGTNGMDGVRCEIRVSERNGGVTLEGVVSAKTVVRGSYQLQISKSGRGGNSDINQSGDFSAAPGSPGSLGIVKLGGDGGSYVAKLKVLWDGRSIECSERVSGSL